VHGAGHVKLEVAQDGVVISNAQMFEFRNLPATIFTNKLPPQSSSVDWFDTNGEDDRRIFFILFYFIYFFFG
jgi:hypothetical protein